MWLLSSAGGLTELGSPGGMVRNPAWLPDGSAVVVESNRAGFRDLYLVPLEGEERQLTDVAEGCFEPDVRADGKALVYVSSQEGNAEIFTRALAGGEPQRLTWSPGGDTAPRWSPDGRQIAWASVRHGHALAYVMNADGSKPRPLATGSDGDQEALSWSSNGEAIAFTERNGNTASVRVVAVDDGRVLFDSRARTGTIDEQPALSADGRAIAFVSDRDGDAAIYAATLHDGAIVRLTRSRGADWLPRWWDGDADD
jgi:Tol biopolymer transport system component